MRRLVSTPTLRVLAVLGPLGIALCGVLGWWQLGRALDGGDPQNYAYALQWPVFGVFVAFMWWKLARDELAGESRQVRRPAPPRLPAGVRPREHAAPVIDEDDAEVVAWNRMLAERKARYSPGRG